MSVSPDLDARSRGPPRGAWLRGLMVRAHSNTGMAAPPKWRARYPRCSNASGFRRPPERVPKDRFPGHTADLIDLDRMVEAVALLVPGSILRNWVAIPRPSRYCFFGDRFSRG